MPAKQHLNFHGTVSTFVCQFHPSLTGAPVLNLPTPSPPQTVLSATRERSMLTRRESRSRCLLVWKKTGCDRWRFISTVSPARRAAFIAPALLASLPFFFVMHDCCRAVLNSCDTVSCRKVSLFSLVICVSSRAIVTNSFVSAALSRAKHCANDFGDFGVLHGVHQCVLGASRVALRLGRCVLLTEGCNQRDILQHLLRTLLL